MLKPRSRTLRHSFAAPTGRGHTNQRPQYPAVPPAVIGQPHLGLCTAGVAHQHPRHAHCAAQQAALIGGGEGAGTARGGNFQHLRAPQAAVPAASVGGCGVRGSRLLEQRFPRARQQSERAGQVCMCHGQQPQEAKLTGTSRSRQRTCTGGAPPGSSLQPAPRATTAARTARWLPAAPPAGVAQMANAA